MATAFPQIPYGWADFEAMRLERCLYVDKTRFLHQLERERFAFLIRPRRFGKSCWVSLLESYYDRNRTDRFETLFAGTDIGRQPTVNRHRYVILRFDFSAFDDTIETDLYNTDMVLYFLDHSVPNRRGPKDPIDTNVRIDYGKLRHLLVTGRRLNGNFDLLRHIIADGEAESPIQASFPLERLAGRENFLSLLHYFGLLSIRGVARGLPRLGIPNQTVKRLMYGYLRDAWDEMDVFSADFYDLLRLTGDMAYEGAWRPAVEYLSGAVARQTAIRDYIDGERVVHAFFAAYLGLTDHYVLHSERELNKGYADLHLEPFMPRHPGIGYGYLIEFKYLKRGEKPDDARAAAAGRQALDQLQGYLAGERLRRHPSVRHIGLALVFHGWELVWSEAVALP